ncbi:MAG: energy-coupling factor ABC transporter ATP-binding protein [Pseudomonadota bacterium]|uniref:energy-coupling factor ABC transporter ATP-binding protein n=1 Tax=Fodinicurvata fenggangensis TaxID=1121830 RepID=UPI001FDFA64A|nr:ABC transporter ATP-binding protein [Fodinicurvata fenggangensis]
MTAKGAIELQGVSVQLGGRVVLQEIDLSIPQVRVALVGRNGSGKSTLGRVMKGLIRPENGQVSVHGLDPAARSFEALSVAGYLFQNSDHQILCPSVLEEISFGLRENGWSRAAAEKESLDLMRRHGIGDWGERAVASLSEGQRRLVCLLAILVMTPRALILDEPFTGLDIPTRRRLESFIGRLPQQVVTISHEPDALWQYDRVIWLEEGRLYADGTPDQVLPGFLEAMNSEAEGMDAW